MALSGTLGSVLVNSYLPKEYRQTKPITKSTLKKSMLSLARKDPSMYARIIPEVKKLGDEFATYEGISVGLDDIAPQYAERDKILKRASQDFWKAKDTKFSTKILLDAQARLRDLTLRHPGDMGMMARSGGRGSVNQLMKSTTSPVVVGDYHGAPHQYLIERGYSEGLSPAEGWLAGDESRGQLIKGQLSTADPGELGKIMATMMSGEVVASNDCKTKNGILMSYDDPNIMGRYLAGTSTVIDNRVFQQIKSKRRAVKVRSPMTCELTKGVCAKCQGRDSYDRVPDIGTNMGIRAAQALAEPLTQMALSAKHGVSLVSGTSATPTGVTAVRQFLEVPGSFLAKATLASKTGKISSVEKAPQGGYDVYVGESQHYIPPNRGLKVKKGQSVEAGDVLSGGLPAPNELVAYKGLGAGRRYLVDSFHDVYKDSGIDVDKRHLELMVKSQLSSVRIVDEIPGFLPGEVVPYNSVMGALKNQIRNETVKKSMGQYLAKPVLHHIPGTQITNSMLKDFSIAGIKRLPVVPTMPKIEAVMYPASRTPLLNPNWMQRLGHRYQKATLLQAAQQGEMAEIHGLDPVPGLVIGKEFRHGPGGTY